LSTAIVSANFKPVDDDDDDDSCESPPMIVDGMIAVLQCARLELMASARQASKFMSASEWIDVARETPAGKIVGPRELRAIINIAWDF